MGAEHKHGTVHLEARPLLGDGESTQRVYAARWYMLVVLSLLAFLQGFVWNQWGPISDPIKPVLGWDSNEIALLANWGPIAYFIAFMPTSWLLDTRGLRISVLLAAGLVLVGCALRSFTMKVDPMKYLTHVGQFLNGLAGPVAMSAAPLLSSTWFPVNQRATATAIMAAANYMGVALSFIVGPEFIRKTDSVDTRSDRIQQYMWGTTGLAAVAFFMALIHFPNKPPHAPSVSAAQDRTDFVAGVKQLFVHKQFWIVASAYGIMTGVYSGWGAYLSPNLKPFLDTKSHPDRAEEESGWLGFYATMAGCVGGILIGRFSDSLGGKMKMLLIIFSVAASVFSLWFALLCLNIVPRNTASLYVSCIAVGFLINGTVPLFYEIAIEAVHPIAEGTTTSLLTTVNNVGCFIFLFLPDIPGLGNAWANWALLASCGVCTFLLFFFKEHYRRLSIDIKHYDVVISS